MRSLPGYTHDDLFSSLRRFARHQEENFFTECVARVLASDEALTRAFVTYLVGKTVNGRRVSTAPITITTQRHFGAAVPDMTIQVGDALLAVENKLFAGRGHEQLEKYLRKSDIDLLAYIAGYHDKGVRVAKHRKYAHPATRSQTHFVWWELFQTIKTTGTRTQQKAPLRLALVQLFRDFGFEPVHGALGDLTDPDESVREGNRRRFASLWGEAEKRLRGQGWGYFMKKSDAWVSEPTSTTRVQKVWLTPHYQPGTLVVRLYVEDRAGVDVVRSRLETGTFPLKARVILTDQGPKENRGYFKRSVSVAVSLQTLLGKRSDPKELSMRLAEFSVAVIGCAG